MGGDALGHALDDAGAALQGIALAGIQFRVGEQVRPTAVDRHRQRHADVRHALDLGLHDADRQHQVAVVDDRRQMRAIALAMP